METGYAHCESFLREHDRAAWLAAMFAPDETRRHLHALYAFAAEIARVRAIVSEPALGEIRLQWWAEALEGQRAGEAAANPVAQALLQTVAECRLPVAALTGMIEARRFDLYNDPMPDLATLEGYCGETYSALFRLAAIALNSGNEPGGADVCGHAGVALGVARILQDLPRHAARGQCLVPADVLKRHGAVAEAVAAGLTSQPLLAALAELRGRTREHLKASREGVETLAPAARPALVPLAAVEPLLKRMEGRNYDPFASDVEPPQWRLQWAMLRFK
ncbi:MAG: phytoene/squalene synthase family protein [Beijerinckiaceae bacterium]